MAARSAHPWKRYKIRFLAHEWETISEMFRALKIAPRTAALWTKGWQEDRDEVDQASAAETKDLIIRSNAQANLDLYRDIKPMLQELFLKGINQLLRKKRNPITGVLETQDFGSEATALGATRFSLAGLKVLESGVLPGAVGGNPLILDGDALNSLNINTIDPRNYTTDQLRAAIESLDTDEGAQEKATNGAPAKDRSSRKRS